jgi:hypothetical protein
MWRYTLLASINFYASMMAYGIAYGLAPESNESTLLKNFTWLQFTITIANALYCLASFLVLMLLLYRERTVFQVGIFNNYHLHIIEVFDILYHPLFLIYCSKF